MITADSLLTADSPLNGLFMPRQYGGVHMFLAESRVAAILFEGRAAQIEAENRRAGVTAENRSANIDAENRTVAH